MTTFGFYSFFFFINPYKTKKKKLSNFSNNYLKPKNHQNIFRIVPRLESYNIC